MSQKQILSEKIADRSARIGVIGMGYVGLPLAVEFAHSGFRATGFEVDAKRAESINNGLSYIIDVPSEQVAELIKAERLQATTDFAALADQDIIIICVPTPLRKTKEPDVSFILAAAEKIQDTLRPGQLVILESTTYPGTTDEVLRPMFDEKGFEIDKDYFLAFSPERVDPGNPQFQTKNIPKVVGGVTEDSADVAAAAYGAVVNNVHRVASARAAEMAKLLENTFRAVNIGMVNELSQLCYTLGIDTWEVIEAAATKPFGFMAFYPGPGIGGHCLVGDETIVVRDVKTKMQWISKIADLFKSQPQDAINKFETETGAEVICNPTIEALSLNLSTQQQEWKPVSYLFRRKFEGDLVTVTTSDNRKVTVTDEHPMLICDEGGEWQTIFAKDVKKNQRLPLQIASGFNEPTPMANHSVDLLPLLPTELTQKIRVRIKGDHWSNYRSIMRKQLSAEAVQEFVRQDYLPLDAYLALEANDLLYLPHEELRLYTGRGPSTSSLPAVINITTDFARLIGYYLAEGCITQENGRSRVRFSFNRNEVEFIEDVRQILRDELGIECSLNHSSIDCVTHIRVASSVFGWFLRDVLQCGVGSTQMRIPDFLMNSSTAHQQELLKGLLRGDGDIYVRTGFQDYEKNGRTYQHHNATAEIGFFSSSPQLFQQTIYLLQGLGFRPTFKNSKPHLQIKGFAQLQQLDGWLGSKGAKLQRYFDENRRITTSRTFKQFGSLVTVPVKSIVIKAVASPVDVYSIEVEDNHTFATSFGIFVHNCIPLDPHYLSWKARMHGFEARFISLAEEVNSTMPQHVVELVQTGLNKQRKAVNGSHVLVLGVAYKRDIDDMRESPALGIIEKLEKLGAEVSFHDPHVNEVVLENGLRMSGIELTEQVVTESDIVVIITDHRAVDYRWVAERAKMIVDTRNATRALKKTELAGKIIHL